MAERAALVEAGRRCGASGDWAGALEHLSAARELGPLDADDVGTLAQSAWMAGRVTESIPLSEEAYRQLCDEGRRIDAAMTALRLSLLWLTRGALTVGTAWLGRARRVLEDEPDGPALAYLAYLDASVGMIDGGEAFPASTAGSGNRRARSASRATLEAGKASPPSIMPTDASRYAR